MLNPSLQVVYDWMNSVQYLQISKICHIYSLYGDYPQAQWRIANVPIPIAKYSNPFLIGSFFLTKHIFKRGSFLFYRQIFLKELSLNPTPTSDTLVSSLFTLMFENDVLIIFLKNKSKKNQYSYSFEREFILLTALKKYIQETETSCIKYLLRTFTIY